MKQIFSFNKSVATRLLLSLALMLTGIGAQAQEVLELDKEYTLPSFKKTYYVFTPETSGKLYTYSTNNSDPRVFLSEDLKGEGIDTWTGNYTGNTYITEVEAGKTYYIGSNFPMDAVTFHVTMSGVKAVEFESITPEEGSVLSLSKSIDIKFNVPAKADGAKLSVKEASADVAINFTNDLWASVAVKKTLYQWLKTGTAQPGDDVILTLLGVVSVDDENIKAGEDGTIVVKFKMPAMPTELTASKVPAEFKKLWTAGDEEGIMTLTFSANIQSVGGVNITNGDLSYEGNGKQWNVTPTINGNTVTIDLTGVERMPLAGSTDKEHFTIEVKTVIDENGNYAYTEDNSILGSFAWTLDYKGEVTNNVEYMFSPDQESVNLKDYLAGKAASERIIMVMVSGDDNYDFSSVAFEYTTANETKTVTVAKADVTIDKESGLVLSIPVPAEIDNAVDGSQVIMYIKDADDAVLTKATWQYGVAENVEFALTLVSPEDGATLEGFQAEVDAIKVNVVGIPEDANEMEIVARIYEPENEDPIYTTYLWPAAPAEGETIVYNYAQTIYDNIDFIKGKDYKLAITATKVTYPAEGGRVEEVLADNAYTIHGAAAPFVYSDITLTDITPNPTTTDIISTDQNTITLTFDGAVNVTKVGTPIGMGAGLKEWTAAKADEEGKVWTVNIPETTLNNAKGSFSVSLFVEDAQGNPVYKTTAAGILEPTQNKENTYYSFTYTCTLGAPDLTVIPEDGTELEVLDKITIKFANGIDPSWTTSENIVLYKGKGTNQEVVQQWNSNYFDMLNEEVCVEWDWDNNYAWALNLDAPVTEPGNYTLVIPNGFFNLGSEYDQALNKITNIHYTIKGEDTPVATDNVTTDPAAGSTVASLKTIKVTWVDAADAAVNYEATAPSEPIVLLDAEGNTVTTATINMSDDWDDPWNMLVITLDTEVTADGTYTLHIPAAIALLNDGSKLSTEQNLTYIISNGGGTDGIASLSAGNPLSSPVYTINGMLVRKAGESLKGLTPGMYIINGKKILCK